MPSVPGGQSSSRSYLTVEWSLEGTFLQALGSFMIETCPPAGGTMVGFTTWSLKARETKT
ncbi:hypothetical protein GCM10009776_15460 [Microbacterium deminutum]|uniref:Uncharacterized protein n=1 Tax=Microbacterium deminutum TaxID=344164 RepID=A0ABN2QL23_9MICO